jgi:hypothetical protein
MSETNSKEQSSGKMIKADNKMNLRELFHRVDFMIPVLVGLLIFLFCINRDIHHKNFIGINYRCTNLTFIGFGIFIISILFSRTRWKFLCGTQEYKEKVRNHKLPHKIAVSFKKFLRGEEDFWITLLGWGVLLYFVSIMIFIYIPILSFSTIFYFPNSWIGFTMTLTIIVFLLIQICGIFWLLFLFIYPFIFTFSIIKSSLRHTMVYVILACVTVLFFVIFHIIILISVGIGVTIILNTPLIFTFIKIKSSLLILINQYY